MKKRSNITSVHSEINVPVLSLNNFYNRLPGAANSKKMIQKTASAFSVLFEEIDWSSAICKVDGMVKINFVRSADRVADYVCMPVSSTFLFTCTRNESGASQLAWGISLS